MSPYKYVFLYTRWSLQNYNVIRGRFSNAWMTVLAKIPKIKKVRNKNEPPPKEKTYCLFNNLFKCFGSLYAVFDLSKTDLVVRRVIEFFALMSSKYTFQEEGKWLDRGLISTFQCCILYSTKSSTAPLLACPLTFLCFIQTSVDFYLPLATRLRFNCETDSFTR